MLKKNPFINISPKGEDKKTHLLLTDQQVKDILNVFNDKAFQIMNKSEMESVFKFSSNTGARLIDCCLLKGKYIKLNNRIVTYMPIKTIRYKREIIAPINDSLYRDLVKYNIKNTNEYLFPKVAERYLRNHKGINVDIIKVLVRAGVKQRQIVTGKKEKRTLNFKYKDIEDEIIGFHCFRHKFITTCVENDMNIVKLSKIVGDNVKTLEKYYIKLREKALIKEVDKMPNF
jgi:integrase